MRLFVGLGNPGARYARNRHNIGFMAVDRIAEDHGFPAFRSRFQGLVSEGRLGDTRVVLLKPQGYMNLSGQSVGEAMRYFKLEPADVVVFHDELDLVPGKCRVKQGGGHAGHNGLRSIHAHVGAEYGRVRLGIGHPGHKDAVSGYVLHDFARAEEGWLDDLMRGISDGAAALAAGDAGRFQNAVALRVAPPRASSRAASGGAASGGAAPGGAKAGRRPKASAKPAQAPAQAAQGRDKAAGAGGTPETAGQPDEAPRSALQRLIDKFR